MDKHISLRLLALLAVVMGLGAAWIAISGLAQADTPATTKTLNRDLEPVIIKGQAIEALAGFHVSQFYVYVYEGGTWTQIPAQVDEVTATGAYTTTEDGRLDADDEIVFMAKDLGDQAPTSSPISASLSISLGWYEIEVTDPVSPTRKGWAYLVHSRVLTPTFAADYVSFDPATHRIHGETYSLGFATPDPWADYLTLGSSNVDILDRTKIRFGLFTEEILPQLPDDLIKDGPVRIIVRGGRVLAYGSMTFSTTAVTVPRIISQIRFSTDFNQAATGATFYNAVVPGGVTVDGVPDTVAAEPVSPWWQLTTNAGTLIQVADTTSMGGTQSNYYVDNAAQDIFDTGDKQHFGDTGIIVKTPNLAFTYTFALYALPGAQPNLGATYEAFFTHPLSPSAILHGDPKPEKVHLPLIAKNATSSRGLLTQGARDQIPVQSHH